MSVEARASCSTVPRRTRVRTSEQTIGRRARASHADVGGGAPSTGSVDGVPSCNLAYSLAVARASSVVCAERARLCRLVVHVVDELAEEEVDATEPTDSAPGLIGRPRSLHEPQAVANPIRLA